MPILGFREFNVRRLVKQCYTLVAVPECGYEIPEKDVGIEISKKIRNTKTTVARLAVEYEENMEVRINE